MKPEPQQKRLERQKDVRDILGGSGALMLRFVLEGLLAIARTKVAAVVLGPAGIGILGQATQFRFFVNRTVQLGFGPGIAKYAAERHAEKDYVALGRLVNGVISLFVALSVALVVVVAVIAKPIAGWVFADPTLWVYAILVAIAIPMMTQTSTVVMLLRGTRNFRALALNGVVIAVLGVSVSVPMVLIFGLDGAVWSLPVAAGIGAIVSQRSLRKHVLLPSGITPVFELPDRDLFIKLSRFGVAGTIIVSARSFGDLLIRSGVLESLGRVESGLLQASWTAAPTMGLVITALIGYAVPTIAAQAKDPERVTRTRDDVLRLFLLAAVPLGTAYVIATPVWLPLLFSGEFTRATTLAYWQMLGQLFFGIRTMMNSGLLARERFRAAIAMGVTQAVLSVALFYALVGELGVLAVPMGFLISNVVMLPLSWWYARTVELFSPRGRTLRLLWTSVIMGVLWVALPARLAPGAAQGALALALLAWVGVNFNRADVSRVREIFLKRGRGRAGRQAGPKDNQGRDEHVMGEYDAP